MTRQECEVKILEKLKEIKAIGQNSRGAKIKKNSSGNDYFGFIRLTNAPAVIVECAFVDNAKDIQIIDTATEQKAMGVAIAKGILKTLGITYKEEKEKTISDYIAVLNKVGIITNVPLWKEKANKDNSVYWLIRKMAEHIEK